MQKNKSIEHPGIVEEVANGTVKVNVIAQSACASCHAKGGCSIGEIENKQIEVITSRDDFANGEKVIVRLDQSLGYKALFFGYVLPFIVVFIILAVAISSGLSEGKSGLLSISVLPVYYILLYFFRDRMKKVFSFSIHKIV